MPPVWEWGMGDKYNRESVIPITKNRDGCKTISVRGIYCPGNGLCNNWTKINVGGILSQAPQPS